MNIIRYSITCRAASAFILLASTAALGGCGEDDDKGKVDGATDTSRADGLPDATTDSGTPITPDGGSAADVASDMAAVPDFGVADLIIAETATAPDAGVKSACIAGTVCYEYAPDYTDANVVGHCSPQMGTTATVCPADLMGERIGRCVTTSTFGTLHTIYYKRVDPRSAQVMCASKGGTWYAN